MLLHRRDRVARTRLLGRLSWLLALLVSGVVGLGVWRVAYWTLPQSYSATASLLLSSQPDVVAGVITGGDTAQPPGGPGTEALVSAPDTGTLERVWAILTSRELLLRLVRKHELESKLILREPEALNALQRMTRFKRIGSVGVSVTVTCRGSRRPGLGALDTETARQLCADLGNSYLAELENYVTEANLRQAGQTREFLATSRHETEAQLQRLESELQNLQSSQGFLDPNNKTTQLLERLKTVEPAYAEAAAKHTEVAGALQLARPQVAQTAALRITQEVRKRNPVLTTLEGNLASLQVDLQVQLASGKTPQHRDVQKLQAQIDSTQSRIQQVREAIVSQVSLAVDPAHDEAVSRVITLEADLIGAVARQAQYARLRDSVQAEMARLPAASRRYLALKRDQEQQAKLLDPLTQGLKRAELVEKYSQTSRFIPLDTAVPPFRAAAWGAPLVGGAAFLLLFLVLAWINVYRNPLGR